MKTKHLLILGGVIFVVIALLALGRFTGTTVSGKWENTDIDCLVAGHQNLALHIHPHLTIMVDGAAESIPANIGVSGTCMAEVHTHDGTGTIHVESNTHGETFVLADFFAVAGIVLERPSYSLSATVNGNPVPNPQSIVLRDGETIVLLYVSSNKETDSSSKEVSASAEVNVSTDMSEEQSE